MEADSRGQFSLRAAGGIRNSSGRVVAGDDIGSKSIQSVLVDGRRINYGRRIQLNPAAATPSTPQRQRPSSAISRFGMDCGTGVGG